ncbi:hypothetical protein [Streptomyces johnsoniae]|uniref:Uncharacterized protein n=1 Tax=Streptomyces johnsoniae TaxID=3075532 RepID=A0ABU2RYJ3_9ACTN|nr:hypothetical protein [Streptomyces sp. DSM 41886]MDT0441827.1 hypothetical protein [Streptomyces sp. DSM 41886]
MTRLARRPEAAYIRSHAERAGHLLFLWWPLWIGLAAWGLRRPWFGAVCLCLCPAAPLPAVFVCIFLPGRWAG